MYTCHVSQLYPSNSYFIISSSPGFTCNELKTNVSEIQSETRTQDKSRLYPGCNLRGINLLSPRT